MANRSLVEKTQRAIVGAAKSSAARVQKIAVAAATAAATAAAEAAVAAVMKSFMAHQDKPRRPDVAGKRPTRGTKRRSARRTSARKTSSTRSR